MYLSDTKIQELIDSEVLLHADASNIGQVTYDLRTDGFYINENKQSEVELGPGDSTFVSCVECVALPNNLTASVLLRNSRIRQGLSLDAPLYFPGHGTRLFYRVTNVSGNTITLDKSKGIAQVAFQRVDGMVAHPYHGAFSDELNFKGLADYSDVYAGELKKIEDKKKEIVNIESRIYGNVLALRHFRCDLYARKRQRRRSVLQYNNRQLCCTRPADYWRLSGPSVRNRGLPC